jgi:membrane fusion protein (multidrug efflux system)
MSSTENSAAGNVDQRVTEKELGLTPVRPGGRRRAFTIFFLVLAAIGVGAILLWLHDRQFETTDDAFVEMHLGSVSPRIDGTIVKVYVEDNQFVRAGDPLVDLDPRDNEVALQQAAAGLSQARSQVLAQQPNLPITRVESGVSVSTAEAGVTSAQAVLAAAEHDHDAAVAKLTEAEADNAKAQADLGRYKILNANEEVSQQEFDQVDAVAKARAAMVVASRANADSAGRVVEQRRAQSQEATSRLYQYRNTATHLIAIREAALHSQEANSQNAEAQVEQAKLKLAYTKIAAPVDGIVMKRSAEVGARVSAGQPLLTIAQIGDLWVTANFKETQLAGLRPGDAARIHIDALSRDFDGYLETIGAGTGAISSVLPPENATGNYVKVVQRIPVRLRFKPNQSGLELLRAGMSVEPEVRIQR